MSGRSRVLFAAVGIAFAGLVLPLRLDASGHLSRISPDQQSAWAATLQTIGLLITIFFAATTLASDRRDARVDRVLAFHVELTGPGPTGVARSRLARFLREKGSGPRVLQVSIKQLLDGLQVENSPQVQTYPPAYDAGTSTPHIDLMLVLRLFERSCFAQVADLLDDELVVSLIGRHVGWWDLAIEEDSEDTQRVPLARLADWSNGYRDRYRAKEGFGNWWIDRQRAFPPSGRFYAALRALRRRQGGWGPKISFKKISCKKVLPKEFEDVCVLEVLTELELGELEELLETRNSQVPTEDDFKELETRRLARLTDAQGPAGGIRSAKE
jgi:hypothetical protein